MKLSHALLLLSVLTIGCSAVDPDDDQIAVVDSTLLTGSVPYRGVSLASAEFAADAWGNGTFPGTHGVDYVYPDPSFVSGYNSADYFIGKGMTTFRLPFRWERLQRTRRQAFDAGELGRLRTTVNRLTSRGAQVVLDPHNYARYGTALVGSAVPNADFADFWSRLANEFKSNLNVIFGLMNEPHDMPTEQWLSAANAAISAIRSAGATNLILVPGNSWTGAHSWTQNWYGTPNSSVMLGVSDPGNNYAFEVHQYLDGDSSGTASSCVSTTIGSERMQAFTSWLRSNQRKGFLGEFGGGNNGTCLGAIDNIVDHLEANADVYIGWTYWAAGPWWGSYFTSLEPSGGADKAQMDALEPHLGNLPPPPSCSDGVQNGNETGVDCGGSCAACSGSCSPRTYEAESMFHSTGGATTGGWNIWSNGYISTNHTFAAGSTSITVSAKGTPAGGVWPRMTLSIAGTNVGSVTVNSANFANYAFSYNASAGSKEVRVVFDNDQIIGSEDRNLLVDKVVIGCPTATSSCTDGVKNGNETGVDCGGSCAACPSCTDGVRNGNETGVDCGGSCPACTSCQPRTYEAESMFHSTGGAVTGGWNIWSNGYVSTNHTFVAGSTTLSIAASGTLAGGAWPHMVVSVGGTVIGNVNVTSTSYANYSFTFTATAGSSEVRIAFDNDFFANGEDRNLLVDKLTVGCPGG